MQKKRLIWFILILVLVTLPLIGTGCSQKQKDNAASKPTIIFGDGNWDSVGVHNHVARIILENGYGYKTDSFPSSTPILFEGIKNGNIHVTMEFWSSMHENYAGAVESGEVIELGVNFSDNAQGLYVPTVIIKGDPERGIEPLAPDLKTVEDLPKYWELFKDPDDPQKGRILGSIPGWATDEQLRTKVKTYGLDKTFNYFSPGSDTALASSLAEGVNKDKPVVGYYWEPTWLIGKYDLTLLGDYEYSNERWEDGYHCEWPTTPCTIIVNPELLETAPEAIEFLKKYKTSSAMTSEALAYMLDNDASPEEAAKWFMNEKEEVWTQWVSEDIANKVKEALK